MFCSDYFEWSGCGDPFYAQFPFNPLPFVPTSENQDDRDQQCGDYNCYELVMGCKSLKPIKNNSDVRSPFHFVEDIGDPVYSFTTCDLW